MSKHTKHKHQQTEAESGSEAATAALEAPKGGRSIEIRLPKFGRGAGGRRWKWLLTLLVLAGVVFLAYGYIHTKNQLNQLSNPKAATQTATQQVVSEVGKLVQLPSGETPTLASVSDASKLKTQVFFADAKNGDKVLIYSKAGKAVLYRPSTNRVIEYSNVNLSGASTQ